MRSFGPIFDKSPLEENSARSVKDNTWGQISSVPRAKFRIFSDVRPTCMITEIAGETLNPEIFPRFWLRVWVGIKLPQSAYGLSEQPPESNCSCCFQ